MADDDDDFDTEDEFEADAEEDGDEDLGEDIDDDVDEELEGAADLVDENEGDDDEGDDEEEESQEAPARATRTSVRKKRKETDALHTVAAREDVRKQLANDVEAFLKRGGAIENVPQDERADPSKKGGGTYGRGSA